MFRVVLTMVVVCAAACSTSSHDPRLTAIAPATVTTLVATPGVITGAELDARAQVDLNGSGAANVDLGWHVRVGDVVLDEASWIDRQTIDVMIPRGLPIGVHDVVAIAPD